MLTGLINGLILLFQLISQSIFLWLSSPNIYIWTGGEDEYYDATEIEPELDDDEGVWYIFGQMPHIKYHPLILVEFQEPEGIFSQDDVFSQDDLYTPSQECPSGCSQEDSIASQSQVYKTSDCLAEGSSLFWVETTTLQQYQ